MKKEQFDKNEHLTPHFTLGEMCRTNARTGEGNLPPSAPLTKHTAPRVHLLLKKVDNIGKFVVPLQREK